MPYCQSCGNELGGSEEFCPSCAEPTGYSSDNDENVVVNVQQSADHANSTAAAGGEGNATASAEMASSDEETAGSTEEDESATKEEVIGSLFSIGIMFGMLGSLISFITGSSRGIPLMEQLMSLPWAIPYWFLIISIILMGYIAVKYADDS